MNDTVKKLQIQLLTHNNSSTIDKTLKSLKDLNANVVVIDHGSTDGTIDLAKQYAEIRKVEEGETRSAARNRVLSESKSEWFFTIEPWEVLKSGHASMVAALDKNDFCYNIMVSQSDMITKPLRLWHKSLGLRFTGHCYESLQAKIKPLLLNAMIVSNPDDNSDYCLGLIKLWSASSPAASEPRYYEAMNSLSRGKYDEFIRNAEDFLFRSTSMSMSVVMTRYYLAWVYAHVKKDARQSFANLVVCLSLKPLMAESWCLLGDIHYFIQKDFEKAYRFYDNAIILGSQRKPGDEWPLQMSRYKDYPTKMMESCKTVLSRTEIINA